jgi:hypothetical protein
MIFIKSRSCFGSKSRLSFKNYNVDDKSKLDAQLWTNWLRKYIKRLYSELDHAGDNFETKNRERISIMNSANPR